MTQQRIRQWYEVWEGQVYVSFSGGKDSTVLLYLVRQLYPEVPAVFVDTGLEYPEIREFVKTVDNVVWLRPKMNFKKVIEKYGYPVISKKQSETIHKLKYQNLSDRYRNYLLNGDERGKSGKLSEKWKYLLKAPFKISGNCCHVMKQAPFKRYVKLTNRRPITGTMASEGEQREQTYLRQGCNAFNKVEPTSSPLSYWLEEDVWKYLKTYKVPYSKIYDMGEKRTGCMFCMYGVHLEEVQNRFQRMKHTHPNQWEYCMTKLGLAEVLDYIGVEWGGQMELMDYSGVM